MTIMQMMLAGGAGPVVGDSIWGGYLAGAISTSGDGVATHYLVVAPKATGETSAKVWDSSGDVTGFTSVIDGPTNSAGLAALGAGYAAATWCEALSIGGYTDWYLPSQNELVTLYYFLKPTTTANTAFPYSGSNANAVAPQPISTAFTSGSPAQTSVAIFQSGGAQAFEAVRYWSSTEYTDSYSIATEFNSGGTGVRIRNSSDYVRAVRRVAI